MISYKSSLLGFLFSHFFFFLSFFLSFFFFFVYRWVGEFQYLLLVVHRVSGRMIDSFNLIGKRKAFSIHVAIDPVVAVVE